MAEHLQGLMNVSMEKIRELVDVNTIIGEPISTGEGTVIIPVSRVSFGFVSGGSDIPAKTSGDVFAGGSGAGVTIKPQAFIVVKRDGDVKLLELGEKDGGFIEGLISSAPEFISKIKEMFGKKEDGHGNSENSDNSPDNLGEVESLEAPEMSAKHKKRRKK